CPKEAGAGEPAAGIAPERSQPRRCLRTEGGKIVEGPGGEVSPGFPGCLARLYRVNRRGRRGCGAEQSECGSAGHYLTWNADHNARRQLCKSSDEIDGFCRRPSRFRMTLSGTVTPPIDKWTTGMTGRPLRLR